MIAFLILEDEWVNLALPRFLTTSCATPDSSREITCSVIPDVSSSNRSVTSRWRTSCHDPISSLIITPWDLLDTRQTRAWYSVSPVGVLSTWPATDTEICYSLTGRHLQSGASHDTFVSFRTQEYNIHFRICPLTIGVYRFTVYGQSYAKQQCPMSLISYSIIGADNYDIKCIPDILWGPTAALSSYGLNLEPNMRSCLMMDNTQPCKISFESPNAHAIQLKILCHSIRSKDIVTHIRYSIHRRKSLGEVSIILTSSLKPGSYRLALFASEDEQSDVYSCVFNYLLHITSPTHYDVDI